MKNKQLSLFEEAMMSKSLEKKKKSVKLKWENAFQKWSDEQIQDSSNSMGCCGYGYMCEWCEDNSYGRPCVRALNKMCRELRLQIDYSKRNFEDIWHGRISHK